MRWILTALFCCTTATATAETVCWDASMGVLPDDPSIPLSQRFALTGTVSMVSLGPTTMRVIDASRPQAVYLQKTDLPAIASGEDWEFEVVMQMHSDDRDPGALDIGNLATVQDDTKKLAFGVDVSAVGFVDVPSTGWVDGLSHTMDASDQLHLYRIVKTGALVELFVDGSATPVLAIPYASFPAADSSPKITLVGTSIIGVADFEIASYTFRRNTGTLDLAACLPLVSAGDALAFQSRYAVPGSLNLLYLTDINGVPTFVKLLLGTADGQGEWSLGAVVPAGLTGLELTFLQFGFTQSSGNFAASNPVAVAFL